MTMTLLGVGSWDAAAWSAAGTWATVGVAVAAAVVALRQVREARTLREAQAQPFVIVTLEPDSVDAQTIILRVENIGQTLARDVRFKFDPPLSSVLAAQTDGYMLSDSALVTDGIPAMPPGMKIERIFDHAPLWGEDGEKQPVLAYEVEVTFSDYKGKRQDPLTYAIDLNPYMSGVYSVRKTIHHAGKALEEIQRIVARWGESPNGLKVWNRDGDAKDARTRERVMQRQAERAAQAQEQSGGDSEADGGPPE